jgi:D-sedoheptulose 7-phosphate isomerase
MVEQAFRELQQVLNECAGDLPKIEVFVREVVAVLRKGNKILTAGNGGSAADALHMAEELVGRYRSNRRALPGICLAADATALTCIANDFGFDHIFSRQIEALGQAGDLLAVFSTSGQSSNLVKAAEAARSRGVKVLAFLGKDGGPLAQQADFCWIVPSQNTARIQELHTWAMHVILDGVEAAFPA